MPNESIHDMIARFKADLPLLSSTQIVRKHVIQGASYILSNDEYFHLRSAIADYFNVHTNEVLLVGSAKLGFSIAPTKIYRHFGNESDIDVVLVSPILFDQIWEAVYNYWRQGAYWPGQQEFKKFLFRGWIRPDKLPPSNMFPLCADWWDFFRALTQSGMYGKYKITGALYKSWSYLEGYQELCALNCKQTP